MIKDVDSRDVGDYSVECRGKTSSAKLDVNVPPVILSDEKYKDAILLHIGKTVITEVKFNSSPQPKVTWKFNQGPLPDPRRTMSETIFGMSALTITKAKRSDAGTYSLLLENDHGKATLNIKVKVIDKPGKPEHFTAKLATETSVLLKWDTPTDEGGSEVRNYVIEKRDERRKMWQPCGSTNEREIVIERLVEGNQYNFRVAAENAVGVGEPRELAEPVTCKSHFCK